MKSYFDKMEEKDAKVINAFNNQVSWFTDLKYNDMGSRIDATAIDKKGRKTHIEIKQRTGKYASFLEFIKMFDTIFLDTGKLDTLSNIMRSGYTLNEQELFISIFNDGDVIIIHNLNQPQEIQWLPNNRLWNIGLKKWENEHRIGLYWWNGIIYQKNSQGKYIKMKKSEIEELRNRCHIDV